MDGGSANWESMSVDDLLALREQVRDILREKLKAKQAELDRRLRALAPASTAISAKRPKRRRAKDAHGQSMAR
jgi:hypothetical protein